MNRWSNTSNFSRSAPMIINVILGISTGLIGLLYFYLYSAERMNQSAGFLSENGYWPSNTWDQTNLKLTPPCSPTRPQICSTASWFGFPLSISCNALIP